MLASTIKAIIAELAVVTRSMFTVILVLCCCCCYTSNNSIVVAAETNTSVMGNIDNQKVPMRIHQATTTDNQANIAKDDYALTITNVSINSAGNADETILNI